MGFNSDQNLTSRIGLAGGSSVREARKPNYETRNLARRPGFALAKL